MKFSFVVPTYNRSHCVEDTIRSVLAQPYAGVEVVVIDDCSRDLDRLQPILDRYKGDPRFKTHRFEKNRGQNVARNHGIAISTGDVVTVLDSDDQDMGADLSLIAQAFDRQPGVGGVFTNTIGATSKARLGSFRGSSPVFDYRGFVDGTYTGEFQFFLRKSFLEQPVFEENLGLKRSCTLLTWLRLGKRFPFCYLDLDTRLYDESGSDRMGNRDNLIADAWELARSNELVLERFGDDIRTVSPSAHAGFQARAVFYTLLAHGRLRAFRAFLKIHPLAPGLPRYCALALLILTGPGTAKLLRKARIGLSF